MLALAKFAKAALPAVLLAVVLADCREAVAPSSLEPGSGIEGAPGKFDPPVVISTAKALRNDDKLKGG
ncbi:MAG: hypothetical protein K0Q59_3291, partial [Paenibacillus sp.]|nr:hypothetical protein [Paenibacillus sp.]